MRCPKCGTEIPEGTLYCGKCGEDIHIVPDYDPSVDQSIDAALEKIGDQIDLDYRIDRKDSKKAHIKPGPKENKMENKMTKMRFYLWVGVLFTLAVVIGLLSFLSWLSVKRYNSSKYQLEQAERFKMIGEYAKAVKCYQRVMEIDGEKVEILDKLADLYFMQNDQGNYVQCVSKILDADNVPDDLMQKAREKMIRVYIKKGDFDSVNRVLCDSDDEYLKERFYDYLSPMPVFSLEPGVYEGMQSLKIMCEGDGEIHYTLDGSVPGENSAKYSLPLILDFGNVTVKACAINTYGVKSEIVTGEYVIERPLEIPQ